MNSRVLCGKSTAARGLRVAATTKAGGGAGSPAVEKWRLHQRLGAQPGDSPLRECCNFSTAVAPSQPSDAASATLPPPHNVASAATASVTTSAATTPLPFESIPGPRPALPLVGTTWMYYRFGPYGRQPSFLAREGLQKKYGPIYREMFGKVAIVSVHEASDIEKVFRAQGRLPLRGVCQATVYRRKQLPELYNTPGLVDSMGEEWYHLRQRVTPPVLQPRSAAIHLPTMVEVAQQFVQLVRTVRQENQQLVKGASELFYRFGLENIMACTLGKRMGALELKPPPEAEALIATSRGLFSSLVEVTYAKPLYKFVTTPSYRRYCRHEENIHRIVSNYTAPMIAAHKHHPPPMEGGGPCPQWQNAEKSPEENEEVDMDAEMKRSFVNQFLKVPDLDIRDFNTVIVDFIAAGISTTAFFLTLLLHRLGQEPQVLQHLQEEADRVLTPLSATSNCFTTETIHNMPYLRATVQEGFRLTTIIPGILRLLEQEVVLQGYKIPPYTPIMCQTRVASRDERNFSRALEFLPERWIRPSSDTNEEHRVLYEETRQNRFLVLPFGFGPRMCVGRRIAENEIYVLLAKLVQNFDIKSSGSIELADFLVVGPKHPVDLWMRDRF